MSLSRSQSLSSFHHSHCELSSYFKSNVFGGSSRFGVVKNRDKLLEIMLQGIQGILSRKLALPNGLLKAAFEHLIVQAEMELKTRYTLFEAKQNNYTRKCKKQTSSEICFQIVLLK